MSQTLTAETTAELLNVDAWALERLVAMGELPKGADGCFDADAVERFKASRKARRAEALADIAALDAPHLGLVP